MQILINIKINTKIGNTGTKSTRRTRRRTEKSPNIATGKGGTSKSFLQQRAGCGWGHLEEASLESQVNSWIAKEAETVFASGVAKIMTLIIQALLGMPLFRSGCIKQVG